MPSFGVYKQSLAFLDQSLCLCLHMVFSFYVSSVFSFSLFYKDAALEFRNQPNLGWFHLEIFTLITFSKTFKKKVHILRFHVDISFRSHNLTQYTYFKKFIPKYLCFTILLYYYKWIFNFSPNNLWLLYKNTIDLYVLFLYVTKYGYYFWSLLYIFS